jgi:HTH-type transcriptional regulator/antitoxin HigA
MSTLLSAAEAFPPGEYLRDELDARNWTVTEFAEIIGRPIQAVSEILNGKKEITTETALVIAAALGTTPELWLNLQTNYRLFEQRSKADHGDRLTPIARRARLRDLVPLAKVRNRGWIPATDDLDGIEDAVLRLLDIDSLDERPTFALAARRANCDDPITPEQTAWLAHVRRLASEVDLPAFDRDALSALASSIPRLLESGPERLGELPPLFARCGVALVFSEGLPGGKLDGAATVLADGRVAIGVTARGDRFDGLVFTMLHECAHLVLDHLSSDLVIVDDDLDDGSSDPVERAANEQASEWLFPGGFAIDSTAVPAIVEAASRYGVHPSVVVGRVQRDNDNWRLHRTRIPKVRPHLAEAGLLR